MQRQDHLLHKASFSLGKISVGQLDSRAHSKVLDFSPNKTRGRPCLLRAKIPSVFRIAGFESLDFSHKICPRSINVSTYQNQGELSDDDDDLCPVDCVREFKTDEEFFRILEKAKETDSLVVVDFYRTSCGSCKYIEQGFAKLCKGSGEKEAPVIFLKHNVIDDYDEQSEVAERLRIKTVPLFHFYKNGVLLEAFPTRDKKRIIEAILKYSSSSHEIL